MGLTHVGGLPTEAAEIIEWRVVARALPGESRSGDQHVVKTFAGGALVAAIDGLGHGGEAHSCACRAASILQEHAREPLDSLVQRCHEALTGTRGAAMSLASFSGAEGTMTWLGVGNVEAVLVSANGSEQTSRQHILSRGGIVGYQLPTLRSTTVSIEQGDVLVLATDGLQSSFYDGLSAQGSIDHKAKEIFSKYQRATDDALVLVVRYLGESV